MSRASDLRDGIVAELETELPDYTVTAFYAPRWTKEELRSAPQIGVRVGNRNLSMDQGPDEKEVMVEIGVVGISPDTEDDTGDIGHRATELAAFDVYDGILETIIDLWMNDGRLAYKGVAEHFPVGITQTIQFDPEQLQRGVYLTMIQVTYRDSEDE